MTEDLHTLEAVARCLAQIDGRFIDGNEWLAITRAEYIRRAHRVLTTIEKVQGGNHTGGLPPQPTFKGEVMSAEKAREVVMSKHLTKAQANTRCSKLLATANERGKSSGHARVKYKVVQTGKLFGKRWKVVAC